MGTTTIVLSISVSLALSFLFKYGFKFLSDLHYARMMSSVAEKAIETHGDEIIRAVAQAVVSKIQLVEVSRERWEGAVHGKEFGANPVSEARAENR